VFKHRFTQSQSQPAAGVIGCDDLSIGASIGIDIGNGATDGRGGGGGDGNVIDESSLRIGTPTLSLGWA
jgi:hypothetical protein